MTVKQSFCYPCFQNAETDLEALCVAVGSPNVKLLYDIYHMQIMEGDIIRTIRDNIQWIGHFHTAGNPGRNDLDNAQELNYPAICRAIRETGYDRFLAHEFTPKADPVDALKAAFDLCDGKALKSLKPFKSLKSGQPKCLHPSPVVGRTEIKTGD